MRFPRLPVKDANGPCWECQEDDVEDCADPCGHHHCDHKAHCDICGNGLDYRPASGTCFLCEAEHLASHQLTDSRTLSTINGQPEPIGIVAILADLTRRFSK